MRTKVYRNYTDKRSMNMISQEALIKLEELIDLRNQVCYEMIEAEGEDLQDLEIKLEEVEIEIQELTYEHGIDDYQIEELEQRNEA